MWREGALKVHDSVYRYQMKVYGEPSRFGIEGGKISKLWITREDMTVCNYDRGWDIRPTDPETQLAMEILIHGNN